MNLENNMTCHSCGIKNDTDAKYCTGCGAELKKQENIGSVDTYFAKKYKDCQICGSLAPTKQVTFNQNIGYLFARSYSSINGRLCKKCINEKFTKMTLTTLILGWWGTISFFITPFYLLGNLINFSRTLGMSKESK